MVEKDGTRITRAQFLKAGAAAGVAAATLGAAGCGGSSSTKTGTAKAAASSSPKRGGVVEVVAPGGSSDSLDPLSSGSVVDIIANGSIYETLTFLTPTWGAVPMLASSWSVNHDATEWTFNLRKGVKWHDGTPMTAQDVEFSFHRVLNPKAASPSLSRISASLDDNGIIVVNDETIKFTLIRPDSAFAVAIGYNGCPIIQNGNSDPAKKPIGTGPFKSTTFKPGQGWENDRNPYYWQPGLPYLDQLRGLVVNDETTKLEAVVSGSATLADSVPVTSVKSIKANPNVALYQITNQFMLDASMDQMTAPFNDERVVSAVKHAIDHNELLRVAGLGYGTFTQDVPVPISNPLYPASLKTSQHNLATAKSLLAAAGMPHGFHTTLYTSTAIPNGPAVATVMQSQLAAAGIDVSIDQYDPTTYFADIWTKKPFAMSYTYQKFCPDILTLVYTSNATYQESKFRSPKLDALVKAGLSSTNPTQQAALYTQALEIGATQSGTILPYFVTAPFVAQKTLGNLHTVPNLNNLMVFNQAYLT